jgi:hypothetical protein
MVIRRKHLRCALAASAGAALSMAHPLGIAAAIAMPPLALSQETRRDTYAAGLSYYGAALWPLIPATKNFFGLEVSAVAAVALWVIGSILLALPWMLVWSSDRRQALWRAPLGLALTVVPPLGIIGWASPLTAAGILFPGTAWLGLVVCAVAGGGLAARPHLAAVVLAAVSALCNVVCSSDSKSLPEWRAVNTAFGGIAHGSASPVAAYAAAEWIQREALTSTAKVLVFPETVVPTWTPSTDAFWRQTLDRLRSSGKTILVGALVPAPLHSAVSPGYDFSADLAALTGKPQQIVAAINSKAERKAEPAFAYENTLILRGAETGSFKQRIPVPIAMWNPLKTAAARLNIAGPGVIHLHGERAAVLICYEQLLIWPVLASMVERPTVLIAIANDHWATGTPIPRFQLAAVCAWARLFHVPYLSAVNR